VAHLPRLASREQRVAHVGAKEGVRVARVQVHHVDHFDAQTLAREVDPALDAAPRPVRFPRHAVADFRRNDHPLAAPSERAAEPLLAQAVRRRGVEELDAEIDRFVDQTSHRALVVTRIPERTRAEPEHVRHETRPPERTANRPTGDGSAGRVVRMRGVVTSRHSTGVALRRSEHRRATVDRRAGAVRPVSSVAVNRDHARWVEPFAR
jgi:hypothetical protein